MAEPPTFAVVIPTHGRPQYLPEALRSVLGQTVTDLECVVVDDASPEPVTLDAFDDPRLRLVRLGENRGPAAARNAGVAASRARFVTFLDDDDWYEPERLERVEHLAEPGTIVLSWVRYDHEPRDKPGRLLTGDVSRTILDGMTPHLSATLLARDDFVPFAEDLDAWEDVDWWIRAAARLPVVTVPENLGVIRRHEGPRTRTSADSRLRSGETVLERHAAWFRDHPRAHAFRLFRLGLTARRSGDGAAARRYLLRSLRVRPTGRALAHLLRPAGWR